MKNEYASTRRTKKKIFVAYLELLEKKERINICSIVKQAGINRGTFYLHFKGGLADVQRQMEEQIASTFSGLQLDFRQTDICIKPELVFNKLNSILLQDVDYFRLILKLDEKMRLINKIKQFIMAAISNNYEVMKYVTNPDNFKLAVQYIVGGVMDCYYQWFMGNIDCSLETLSEFLCKLVKEGLKGCIRYAN